MKLSFSTATAGLSILLIAAAIPAQTTAAADATLSVSKVRIVRLSEVRGKVLLDRANGRGLEPAITNLPIVEQNRLQTGTGAAEVEFEDNSTLRVAPDSIVEFRDLSRTAAGTTISSVRLVKGMAYVALVKSRGNEFNLLFGDHKISLPPATHIRLRMSPNDATLSVFDGAIMVDGPQGTVEVSKKKTVTFFMGEGVDPTVAKEVPPDPFDSWDKQAAQYHARMAAFGNSPYSYGSSDMMYYGAFSDAGGCGSMWRPYFTSAAWDPYSAGSWAWYQGAGYSWVSPYPWGWTPYHYGSWNYCPGAGWGWQPGGTWSGLDNGNLFAFNPGNGIGLKMQPHPIAPPHPPRHSDPTIVAVVSKPIVRSEMGSNNSFLFRKDSAGLGVPRGELGGLNKFSNHAIQKGVASTPIYVSMGGGSTSSSGGTASPIGTVAPVAIHRGSMGSASSGESYSGGSSSSSGSYRGGSGGSSSGSYSPAPAPVSRPSSPAPVSAPSGGGRPR